MDGDTLAVYIRPGAPAQPAGLKCGCALMRAEPSLACPCWEEQVLLVGVLHLLAAGSTHPGVSLCGCDCCSPSLGPSLGPRGLGCQALALKYSGTTAFVVDRAGCRRRRDWKAVSLATCSRARDHGLNLGWSGVSHASHTGRCTNFLCPVGVVAGPRPTLDACARSVQESCIKSTKWWFAFRIMPPALH
jgi:hypothetical protein